MAFDLILLVCMSPGYYYPLDIWKQFEVNTALIAFIIVTVVTGIATVVFWPKKSKKEE